jgi:hypothetical protein
MMKQPIILIILVKFVLRGIYMQFRGKKRIAGVMVSVLASSTVDLGSSPGRVKPNAIKLVFVASPLSNRY